MRQTIKNLRMAIKDYNKRTEKTQMEYEITGKDEITVVLRNLEGEIVWRRRTNIDEGIFTAIAELI